MSWQSTLCIGKEHHISALYDWARQNATSWLCYILCRPQQRRKNMLCNWIHEVWIIPSQAQYPWQLAHVFFHRKWIFCGSCFWDLKKVPHQHVSSVAMLAAAQHRWWSSYTSGSSEGLYPSLLKPGQIWDCCRETMLELSPWFGVLIWVRLAGMELLILRRSPKFLNPGMKSEQRKKCARFSDREREVQEQPHIWVESNFCQVLNRRSIFWSQQRAGSICLSHILLDKLCVVSCPQNMWGFVFAARLLGSPPFILNSQFQCNCDPSTETLAKWRRARKNLSSQTDGRFGNDFPHSYIDPQEGFGVAVPHSLSLPPAIRPLHELKIWFISCHVEMYFSAQYLMSSEPMRNCLEHFIVLFPLSPSSPTPLSTRLHLQRVPVSKQVRELKRRNNPTGYNPGHPFPATTKPLRTRRNPGKLLANVFETDRFSQVAFRVSFPQKEWLTSRINRLCEDRSSFQGNTHKELRLFSFLSVTCIEFTNLIST